MGTGAVLSWPKWARILAITLASVMAAIHLRREKRNNGAGCRHKANSRKVYSQHLDDLRQLMQDQITPGLR
jgi:hypothetical protein